MEEIFFETHCGLCCAECENIPANTLKHGDEELLICPKCMKSLNEDNEEGLLDYEAKKEALAHILKVDLSAVISGEDQNEMICQDRTYLVFSKEDYDFEIEVRTPGTEGWKLRKRWEPEDLLPKLGEPRIFDGYYAVEVLE